MTAPTQHAADRDASIGSLQDSCLDRGDESTPQEFGYPEIGHGIDEAPESHLPTFDEMLPATRAFYRRSSKSEAPPGPDQFSRTIERSWPWLFRVSS